MSSSPVIIAPNQNRDNASISTNNQNCMNNSVKSMYPADQQVKFLHLQAEVDSLLQQLQILKQQKLTSVKTDTLSQSSDANRTLERTSVCC